MTDSAIPRRLAAVAAGIAAALCGWLVVLHVRMIVSPAPQEMREGAIVWLTRLLLEGRNPYALAELPASTNAYGILYHLAVLPFAWFFGNSYAVHRAVSATAIAASCLLMYRLLRHLGADRLLSASGTILFYASSLYFVAPLARPDSLGVFFCVASLAVLFKTAPAGSAADGQYSLPRFLAGLALALLALLTKIYLAFPPFILAAYVLLFVSIPRGLFYGAVAAAASAAALWSMTLVFPAYISVSVVDNINTSTYYDVGHAQQQTLDWLLYSLPLTVGLVAVAAGGLRRLLSTNRARGARRRVSPWAFGAAVNAGVFFGLFAGHPGAHMTYLFHLVTPLLMLALLPAVQRSPWSRALVVAALPVAFLLNASYFPLTFGRFRAAENTFATLQRTITGHRNVLGSTEVAGPLALAGRRVFDSGHSEYFGQAGSDRRWPGLVPRDELDARWTAFLDEIDAGLEHRRFDLVVRSRRPGLIPSEPLQQHYRRVATYDVDFAWSAQRWPLDVWEPQQPPQP
jgi:hypothetical protein